MEYTISRNDAFNSLEISFDGKPSEAVREALKSLRFRWHSVKKVWYGYATEAETRAAIEATAEGNTAEGYFEEASDGYLGAVELTGNLYAKGVHLYGSELSKAVREALKANGIKGVTVSSKTFAGGQEINVTMKVSPAELISLEEFRKTFELGSICWVTDLDGSVKHRDGLPWNDCDAIEQIRQKNADRVYRQAFEDMSWKYGMDLHNVPENFFGSAFRAKIDKVQRIMSAFNHDDSNGMVDYFDRHFYDNISIKLDK